MRRYGNKAYPDDIIRILNNAGMTKAVMAFARSEFSPEAVLFLQMPWVPERLYEKFIKEGSEHGVNISGELRKKWALLANDGSWDDPGWDEIIQETRGAVATTFNDDNLERFWKSEQFKSYHERNGGSRDDKRVPDNPKLIEIQNDISSDVNRGNSFDDLVAFGKYLVALNTDGPDKTRGQASKFLRSEGIKMTPDAFNAVLVDKGYAKAPVPPKKAVGGGGDDVEDDGLEENGEAIAIEQIQLNTKMLKLCGFVLIKKTEQLFLISKMIQKYMAQERIEAIKVFQKILKAEEKAGNKALPATPFVDLMKLMKKKKAFIIQRNLGG